MDKKYGYESQAYRENGRTQVVQDGDASECFKANNIPNTDDATD